MGYQHIENLYKRPEFLAGEDAEVYALEKIHGTSAHVRYRRTCVGVDKLTFFSGGVEELTFFSGGEKAASFDALFDRSTLLDRCRHVTSSELEIDLVVYGEAYGGRQQGMKATYGDRLRFVAFDVQANGVWLHVRAAHVVVTALGLEFVDFARVPCTLEALDRERDRDSTQALRNGCGSRPREGIVIRPIAERTRPNGSRVILKHKRPEFSETKTPREVDPTKVQVLADAEAVATEWVTATRLDHVLDHLRAAGTDVVAMAATGAVCRAMLEDVRREGEGEIAWSPEAERAVGRSAARLFKARLTAVAVPV